MRLLSISPRRLLLAVLFLVIFLMMFYDANCSAESDNPMLYAKQEAARLKEQRTSIRQSEAKVLASLERARKASSLMSDQSSTEDRKLMRDAIKTSEESLATVQNLRAKIEARSKAVEATARGRASDGDFAVVTVLSGSVQKQSGSPIGHGGRIYENEMLKTGSGSFVEIFSPDSAYLMLAPNSTVLVGEIDRTTALLTMDVQTGKVHAEKYCADGDSSCWATRYRIRAGFLSFAGAEFVYERRSDGTEIISVLEGAVVFREKASKKATTIRLGEQLILG
ncbi:MAG TPA: hypothetical protein VK445_05340, partial [Dissulfurispiraceae bacterium]|nr:hypothetical protein [Dissulfurispiraceae bacterium]